MMCISLYRRVKKGCPGCCSVASIEHIVPTLLRQWQSWLENWVYLRVSCLVTRAVNSIVSNTCGWSVVQMRTLGCKFTLPATAGSTLNHRQVFRALRVRLPVRTGHQVSPPVVLVGLPQ